MAAISFDNQPSLQQQHPRVLAGMRPSDIDRSYRQICPQEAVSSALQINVVLNTIKSICRARDPDKSRTYILWGQNNGRCEVIMQTQQKETCIVGHDPVLRVFYGTNQNSIRFYRMVRTFQKPLSEKENSQIQAECQYSQKAREALAKLIQLELQFAPPSIVCDESDDEIAMPTQTKYLPPENVTTPNELLKELIQGNQGIFFGHNHLQIEGIAQFLSNKMEELKKLGLKQFYFEIPARMFHQTLALFNNAETKDTAQALNAFKNTLDMYKVSGSEHLTRIALAAKMQGIEVWPVDAAFSLSEMNSPEMLVDQRDQVMTKNIRYYSASLQKNEKYGGLFGFAHHQIGTTLSIPIIRFVLEEMSIEIDDKVLELQKMCITN